MRKSIGASMALLTIATASPLNARNNNSATFKDIEPTGDLIWTPCYTNFTCANLEVPLDYENPSLGSTNVAFIRWSTPNQPAKGDLIMNPGGPGGSAVGFVLQSIDTLVSLIGSAYNIVGMDPRGVNNSGPNLDCFKGQPAVRDTYGFQYHSRFDPRSNVSMDRIFVDSGAFGDYCSEKLGDDVQYANTPATARDMLTYAELLAVSNGERREDAKVNYYGVSYGSALGTTFAALHPDRVGRFVIDGNMDVEDYYVGSWIPGIRQGDAAIEGFCQMCFEAGPQCAFYKNDTSAGDVQARLDAILADMEENPIPVTDSNFVQFPATVGHMDLRAILFGNSYDSFGAWPTQAVMLAQLEQRNGSMLALLSGAGAMMPAECDGVSEEYSLGITKYIISGTDQMGRYNISTREKWYEYHAENVELSGYLGSVWAKVMTLQCRKLRWKPPVSQRFYGESNGLMLLVKYADFTDELSRVQQDGDVQSDSLHAEHNRSCHFQCGEDGGVFPGLGNSLARCYWGEWIRS